LLQCHKDHGVRKLRWNERSGFDREAGLPTAAKASQGEQAAIGAQQALGDVGNLFRSPHKRLHTVLQPVSCSCTLAACGSVISPALRILELPAPSNKERARSDNDG
jgi:hypothetical protein